MYSILLKKLKHCELKRQSFKWLKSDLSNRYQSIKLGKCISIALLILFGVPQGSVIGDTIP